MAAIHGGEKINRGKCDCGAVSWWASPAGSRSCSSTSCQRRKLLAVAGRRHAMGYNTVTRRPRGTGDLDSRSSIRAWDWTSSGGYDRRPVSMALLRAKDGQELAFSFGLSRRRSARLPLPYRQLSYYLFLLHSHHKHSHTGRQTDRHTPTHTQTHTHTTPTTWGAFWSEEEGAWQRPFLFSLVHQLGGRHITHHTRFLW